MEANLRLTDTLLCGVAQQVLVDAAPLTPADGDIYICGNSGGTLSTGQANNVARYRAATTSWEYYVPKKGWKFWENLTGSTWIYDGTQWAGTLSISNINASVVTASGYVNATEIRTSNSQRISSGGVGSFTGLTSTGGGTFAGGKVTLAPATTSYASFNVPTQSAPVTTPVAGDIWRDSNGIVFFDSLYANNSARPAWGAPYKPIGVGASSAIVEASGALHLFCGFYDNGTNPVGSDTGKYATLAYVSSVDGSFRFVTSTTTVTNGVTIADLVNRVQFSRQGGVGFFGTNAPTAKPAVTGSRGGNAALASLLTQLAACGLITDSTTA
jgi:hypothetical protein